MKSTEVKLANDLATATESKWFNPAIMGHILSDQPLYTIDRVMEMVAYIIKYQAGRYKVEFEKGNTSEGLFLANELGKTIAILQTLYQFDSLALPKKASQIIKELPEAAVAGEQDRSWLRSNLTPVKVEFDHPFI